MKLKYGVILCILMPFFGCKQNNIVEAPLTPQLGYGPFNRAGSLFTSYKNPQDTLPGIPAEWNNVKMGAIETDIFQTVYQNYYQGKITEELFEARQKSWNWTPDSLNYSKKSITTQVAFAYGIDAAGTLKMVVDANNNRDFNDDRIFIPLTSDEFYKTENIDSLLQEYAIMITTEQVKNQQVIQKTTPLMIYYHEDMDMFFKSFPEYAVVELNGQKIAVSSGFSNLTYNQATILSMTDTAKKTKRNFVVAENEYIVIDGKVYKNKGVRRGADALVLEKIDMPKEKIYSTQAGFRPFPFEGEEFGDGTRISLDDYRGKYLFVDFWGLGCRPCIEELPFLKTLYESLDTSKIDFLGIVENPLPEALKNAIEKYEISWPQILSNEENDIIKSCNVTGFPTTILIDPNGVIVEKGLRGKALTDKIEELLEKNL